MTSESLWSGLGVVAAVLAAVGACLGLDWLGNRWRKALPEEVQKHGLLGLALAKFREKNNPGRTDAKDSTPHKVRVKDSRF